MATTIEADCVVVGAGSAGCVLAGRLSEDSGRQVVLVEAGPDWRSGEALPEIRSLNCWRALDETVCGEFQWQGIEAVRMPGQPPRPYLRGRGLGGSSVVNGMVAMRATPDDYDRWAADGCPGWSYEDMLPYLRRMEDDADYHGEPYHGTGGPIPVTRITREDWGPLDNALAESALGRGHGWHDDYNAPTATGISPVALNVRDNARVTTNDAYVEPARDRTNLKVLGGATVDTILLDGTRVVGVRVRIAGEWTEIRAQNVVLAAGAIHSPAILLRSGIGPGGPVVKLPVGHHLQDHPLALFWLHLRPEARPGADDAPTSCRLRYSSGLAGTGENDMVMGMTNQTPAAPKAALGDAGATGTWGGVGGGRDGGGPGLFVICGHQQVSRGSLRLASADPDATPVIEENLLGEAVDLARMRDGVHRALDLLADPSFGKVVEHAAVDLAGRGVDTLVDDAAIDRWLLETIGDTAHICGTCRMGAADDPRAVVDPRGHVLGVDGLWVADASVFPEVPRANINFPVIAAAERLADLIGADLTG